jgi:hypothetical protein
LVAVLQQYTVEEETVNIKEVKVTDSVDFHMVDTEINHRNCKITDMGKNSTICGINYF